jgi:hypothetical protein
MFGTQEIALDYTLEGGELETTQRTKVGLGSPAVAHRRSSRRRRISSARPHSWAPRTLEQCCIDACIMFEAECTRILSAHDQYLHGSDLLSPELLCVVACADACRLTVSAIRRGDPRLQEVSSWCDEVCRACVDLAESRGPHWAALAAGAEQCAAYCSDVALATSSVSMKAPERASAALTP